MSDTGISGGPDASPERPPTEATGEPDADERPDGGDERPDGRASDGWFGNRTTQLVIAVVAVLGVVGTFVFFFLWQGEKDEDAREDDVQETAEEFLRALFEVDGATINEDFDRVQTFVTGEAVPVVERLYGDPEVRQQLAENRVASRWDPRDIYVQNVEGDTARVFAVGDLTIANTLTPQPVRDQIRIEIGLQRVDGEWKIFEIRVLEAPASASAGDFLEPNLPEGATTTTTTPG